MKIELIREKNPESQLRAFADALFSKRTIPAVVPGTFDARDAEGCEIPEGAEFAVATSGTKGKPKLLFRTVMSWRGFLDEQNRAFGIGSGSRMLISGSLAFTGNMNFAFDSLFTPFFLKCSSTLRADSWASDIYKEEIDTVYMIPDKIRSLSKLGLKFPSVRNVILGSQFVGKEMARSIFGTFPEARVVLYYGASETNYISFRELKAGGGGGWDETDVGRVFPGVDVRISGAGHILVRSPYLALGAEKNGDGFFDTNDTGTLTDGILRLCGRADDVISVRGEKINRSEIERRLLSVAGVEEALVSVEDGRVVADIAGGAAPERIPESAFDGMKGVFIPRRIRRHERLLRSESGKIVGKPEGAEIGD